MNAIAALLVAFVASLPVERLAAGKRAPAPSLAPRVLAARFALFTALDAAWLGALGRPLLAGFATLATAVVVTVISIHKRRLVGEPLVFSDFGLVRLIVRHPELYYLGTFREARFVAGAGLAVAGIGAWFWFEPPQIGGATRLLLLAGTAGLAAAAWSASRAGWLADRLAALAPAPALEVDVGRYGLLATLALYGLRWRTEVSGPVATPLTAVADPPGPAPDLVVIVQIESFLDPVRAGLAPEPLPGLARARSISSSHGPLGGSRPRRLHDALGARRADGPCCRRQGLPRLRSLPLRHGIGPGHDRNRFWGRKGLAHPLHPPLPRPTSSTGPASCRGSASGRRSVAGRLRGGRTARGPYVSDRAVVRPHPSARPRESRAVPP